MNFNFAALKAFVRSMGRDLGLCSGFTYSLVRGAPRFELVGKVSCEGAALLVLYVLAALCAGLSRFLVEDIALAECLTSTIGGTLIFLAVVNFAVRPEQATCLLFLSVTTNALTTGLALLGVDAYGWLCATQLLYSYKLIRKHMKDHGLPTELDMPR